MASLKGKTVFITGASRGIGRAIALRCAGDGANVVIAAKTVAAHPKLPGTIHTVAEEVQAAGGSALASQLDVRDEAAVNAAVGQAVARFGAIDVLVNNASAINISGTMETPIRRFDLMMEVNVRATFLCSQACIPHLKKASNAHILNISPPLNLHPRWFKDHVAYTMSKYGMSMCTLGMAAELAEHGIAVNSLWPRTTIATSAVAVHFPQVVSASRTADIMADAAYLILTAPSRTTTGSFFLDEDLLRENGVTDFDRYAVKPGQALMQDLFLD